MSYFSESFELKAKPKEGNSVNSNDTEKVSTIMEACKIQLEALFGDKYNFRMEYL